MEQKIKGAVQPRSSQVQRYLDGNMNRRDKMEKLRWTIRRWIEVHKDTRGPAATLDASNKARHDLTIVEAQCTRLAYETPCVTYTPSQLNRFNCMWKQYHDDL
tara:strand:- start:2598 stop:2906 length:309 start_codon:yes stop_codon:yes gene_type:complete